MKRLRDLFPEMYRLVYAEERARRGLPAVDITQPATDWSALDAELAAAGLDRMEG